MIIVMWGKLNWFVSPIFRNNNSSDLCELVCFCINLWLNHKKTAGPCELKFCRNKGNVQEMLLLLFWKSTSAPHHKLSKFPCCFMDNRFNVADNYFIHLLFHMCYFMFCSIFIKIFQQLYNRMQHYLIGVIVLRDEWGKKTTCPWKQMGKSRTVLS